MAECLTRKRCATGDADSSAAAEKKESLGKTLYLGALFGGWYLFNIWFNMCAAAPSPALALLLL